MSDLKVLVNSQSSSMPGPSASAVEASASIIARPRPANSVLEDEASPQASAISKVSAVSPMGPVEGCRMVMFDENQTEPLVVWLDNAVHHLADACSEASQSSLTTLFNRSQKRKKDKKWCRSSPR